jgi:cell wall-associated NlpC family hydrolase
VIIGSNLSVAPYLNHHTEASVIPDQHSIVSAAMMYLNAPSIKGGKSPFGIDASGLTQMAYKLNGIKLQRTAAEQSTQGEALSFIEEAKAGDLVFFDNKEGIIDHVGILLENNYIIHSYGCVRIDRIDHTGIFNLETNTYTHSVRVIKSIV